MMEMLTALLDRLLSQEVARANAAGEALRLQDSRRQLDEVNAYLVAHHHPRQDRQVMAEAAGTAGQHDVRWQAASDTSGG